MRALLCLDGGRPGDLVERLQHLLPERTEYLVLHVVDTRARVALGLLRAGLPGAGPLAPEQRAAIESAERSRADAVLGAAEEAIRAHGLASAGTFRRVGEPGREICSLANDERVDVIVLHAKRRARPAIGPASVGHTARFVLDHARCPVLLLKYA